MMATTIPLRRRSFERIMKIIVFDLEFTLMNKTHPIADIIEIGAIELKKGPDGKAEMVDLFQTYVRPTIYRNVSEETTTFTGITNQMVEGAPTFSEAIRLFLDWIGSDQDYYLCAWSESDKHQLIHQCTREHLSLKWLRNYNDIQKHISRLHATNEVYRTIGLRQALELCQIPALGNQHRAIDDAYNTAKLYKLYSDRIVLEQNEAARRPTHKAQIIYSSGTAEKDNPFAKLADLFSGTTDSDTNTSAS